MATPKMTKDIRSQLGRMFLLTRVVELGSFAAAGKELGLSPALVSTAVAELESNKTGLKGRRTIARR